MNRVCHKCGAIEDIRFNFGGDMDGEMEFHSFEGCLQNEGHGVTNPDRCNEN